MTLKRPDFLKNSSNSAEKSQKSISIGGGSSGYSGSMTGFKLSKTGSIRFGNGYKTDPIEAFENSAAAGCLRWIWANVHSATLKVSRVSQNGNKRDEKYHPIVEVLENPNPFDTWDSIMDGSAYDYNFRGNVYLWKDKSTGKIRIYWLSEAFVTPMRRSSRAFGIDFYRFTYGGKTYDIAPQDMIHIKNGRHPLIPEIGRAPFVSADDEVATDEYAARWSANLMGNQARPSFILSGKNTAQGGMMTDDEADDLKEALERQYGGKNIGRPAIFGREFEVHELSLKPSDLELGSLRHVPEQRICSTLGISPKVIHLGTSEKSSTYNNLESDIRSAFTQNLMPFWRIVAKSLKKDLLSEWGDNIFNIDIEFDTSEIVELQESLDSKIKRAKDSLVSGGITINEYRAEAGKKELPGADIFLIPRNLIAVRVADLEKLDLAMQLNSSNRQQLEEGQEDPKDEEDKKDSVDGEIIE